jgi:bacterial/archaeal transporter family-2 protein
LSATTALALLAALLAGAVVALQPPVNAELGRSTTVLTAATVSAVVTAVLLFLIFAVFGDWSSLGNLGSVPKLYLTGGLYGAVIVTVSLVTVKYLGAGRLVAAVIAGQLIVAAALDAAGVLGLERIPLSPLRILGILALIAGTILVTLR